MVDQSMGKLEVITGCMFSGKTEELLRRIERVRIAKLRFALFKPVTDDRYSTDSIMTHYGREFPAVRLPTDISTYADLHSAIDSDDLDRCVIVGFDEGNFFLSGFISLCNELVARGKRVIVAGLDLTYQEKPFGPMPTLMALADELVKLTAVCVHCGGVATRSRRLASAQVAPGDDADILVGGTSCYEANCRNCFAGHDRGVTAAGLFGS